MIHYRPVHVDIYPMGDTVRICNQNDFSICLRLNFPLIRIRKWEISNMWYDTIDDILGDIFGGSLEEK